MEETGEEDESDDDSSDDPESSDEDDEEEEDESEEESEEEVVEEEPDKKRSRVSHLPPLRLRLLPSYSSSSEDLSDLLNLPQNLFFTGTTLEMIENGLPVGTLTGAGDAVLQLRVRGDSKVEYVVNGIVEQVSTRTITSFPLYIIVVHKKWVIKNRCRLRRSTIG